MTKIILSVVALYFAVNAMVMVFEPFSMAFNRVATILGVK